MAVTFIFVKAGTDTFTGTIKESKGGKQNIRDSGLIGLSDEELQEMLKNPNISQEMKNKIKKHLKANEKRNKQKRQNNKKNNNKKKPKLKTKKKKKYY